MYIWIQQLTMLYLPCRVAKQAAHVVGANANRQEEKALEAQDYLLSVDDVKMEA